MFEKAGLENWELGAEAAAAAMANWSCICCWIKLKDELGDELLFKSDESCSIGEEEVFELKLELLLLLLELTNGFIRNCCCCWDCWWNAKADKIWLGLAEDQLGDEGCDDTDDDDDEDEDEEEESTDELTESLAMWTLLLSFSSFFTVDCFCLDFEEFLYEDVDEEEDDEDDDEEEDDDDLSDCGWLLTLALLLVVVLDEWHLWLDLSRWAFKLW